MKTTAFRSAALAILGLSSAEAQRPEETPAAFVAIEARQAPARDSIEHPTGRRLRSGFGIGFATGLAVVHTNAWVKGGLAGYFAGIVVGSALIPGPDCSFKKRLGVSLMGALVGAAVSFVVARQTYLAKNGEAVVATIVAGGAPVAGAAMALRRCD